MLEELPQLPPVLELDDLPTLQDVKTAVESLKCGKAPGPDGIPAEVFKHGGEDLLHRLSSLVQRCWRSGGIPQQWLHATIATLYKRKGEKSNVAITAVYHSSMWLEKF